MMYCIELIICLFSVFGGGKDNASVLHSINSVNVANCIVDDNSIQGVSGIAEYYGWKEIEAGHKWTNLYGDEIRVVTNQDKQNLESVELLTRDSEHLKEILATLQYTIANAEQKEFVPGRQKVPKEMYASGRKRVAVYPQGNKTLIVFFRSTKQGFTRYGPPIECRDQK